MKKKIERKKKALVAFPQSSKRPRADLPLHGLFLMLTMLSFPGRSGCILPHPVQRHLLPGASLDYICPRLVWVLILCATIIALYVIFSYMVVYLPH